MPISIVFASTILVFWAVAFVPYALKERRFGLLASVSTVVAGSYVYVSWDVRAFPYNLIGALLLFFLAFGGGILQHRYNLGQSEE